MHTGRFSRCFAMGVLLIVSACKSSTEPGQQVSGRHPIGIVTDSISIGLRPYGIAMSGAFAIVTQLDGAQVVRLDAANSRVLDSVRVGNVPTGITFLTDATSAAVTNQMDGTIGFIDFSAMQQTSVVNGPSTTFRVLTSRDGKHLYATASSGSLGIIGLPSHAVEASVNVGSAPNGLALSPDGATLYVSAMTGSISVINTATRAVTGTISLPGTLQDIAVSPDGGELYVASESGNTIHVLDAKTGTVKASIPMSGPVFGLSLTPDGAQLYATSPETGQIWIVDRTSRNVVKTLTVGGMPRRIAFDQLGSRAAVSNEAGYVSIIQ